jgi:hydrogenase assembly chaperone HypC/HupF
MCFDTVGQVLAATGGEARVAFDGIERTVSLVLLQADGVAVAPGDWVRSHTGLAVERLHPAAAQAELAAARAMRESEDAP